MPTTLPKKPNYTEHFNSPLMYLTLPWVGGIVIGRSIHYRYSEEEIPECVRHHEYVHQTQMDKHGVIGFYLLYVKQWIMAGFSYEGIEFEQEAYKAQEEFHVKSCKHS